MSWYLTCECGGSVDYTRMPTGTYNARCDGCGTEWRGIDVYRKSGDSFPAGDPWRPLKVAAAKLRINREPPVLNKSGGSDVPGMMNCTCCGTLCAGPLCDPCRNGHPRE